MTPPVHSEKPSSVFLECLVVLWKRPSHVVLRVLKTQPQVLLKFGGIRSASNAVIILFVGNGYSYKNNTIQGEHVLKGGNFFLRLKKKIQTKPLSRP